jgi:hypothetical protein
MGACNCQNEPSANFTHVSPDIKRPNRSTPAPVAKSREPEKPKNFKIPMIGNGDYWLFSVACAKKWESFKESGKRGVFAVTKFVKGGGCAWSVDPHKPIEVMRRAALEICNRYSPDCKIIDEQ